MGPPAKLLRKLLRRLAPAEGVPVAVAEVTAKINPFTEARAMSGAEAAAYRRRLDDLGVRLFPYPFASSVAIASDIDNSERDDFEAYVDLLVRTLGLDFGDSFRLFRRRQSQDEALALFRCDGAPPPWSERERPLDGSLGFVELLRQLHLGNVDHLHGLDALGGRVIWLPDVVREADGRWIAPVPEAIECENTRPFNFRADIVPVFRLAVRAKAALTEGAAVRLHLRAGAAGPPVLPLARIEPDAPERPVLGGPGGALTWFELARAPDWPDPPLLPDIARVEIDAGGDGGIEAVALTNFSRSMVREALATLADRLGIHVNLLTDHSSKVFVNRGSETRHGARGAERAFETPLAALYGRAGGTDLAFSALGDDPESICYVLPELRERSGLRFINPGGKSGEPSAGFDPLETVVPTTVRDASTIYLARRCKLELPADAEVTEAVRKDMGTRSFPHRITALLDELRAHPGRTWPVYTHLGNLTPKRDRTSPYFPVAPLYRLQNLVFNVTGDVRPKHRTWFTRASVLYDHALVVRSIAPHVERDGENVIRIRSWHDDALGYTLPVSAHQLHGLTFYVGDAHAATVLLDGEPIDEITRNAADETGRPSVTIVGAGIRHPITRAVEPCVLTGSAEERLVLRDDLDPMGGQFIAWSERRSSPSARVGLLVEPAAGGAFHFGDADLAPARCDATYALPAPAPGAWCRRVAPFYAMTWRAEAVPGGPLPAHRPKAVTVIARGESGDRVEIDRVEMLRPATAAPTTEPALCVVGGRASGGAGGPEKTITLAYEGDRGVGVVREDPIVDAAGHFVFTGVPVGVTAEITVTGPGGEPPRRTRIEVRGNDMSLVLA